MNWINKYCTSSAHPSLAEIPEDQTIIDNLKRIDDEISKIPLPFVITSGYRPLKLNTIVGGKPTSKHLTGNAVDLYSKNLETLYNWIKRNLPYDKLLLEGNAWIHYQLLSGGNQQIAMFTDKQGHKV